MRRFRRKRRGTWFPVLGTAGPEGRPFDDDAALYAEITLPNNGNSQPFLSELTYDHYTDEGAQADGINSKSLADFQGSEYLLQRIVGKCHISLDQLGGQSTFAVAVVAGFFVAREALGGEDVLSAIPHPIGADTDDDKTAHYGPMSVGNIQEPWIWRRTWILGNRARGSGVGTVTYPTTTADYHSVSDGPHIDAKTRRRVHRESRLWFFLQARNLGANFADPFQSVDVSVPSHLKLRLDYRLFGMLRKARNTGTM